MHESVGNLFEQGVVRVEDPALADCEEEEDGDDAEGGLHLRPHVDSLGPPRLLFSEELFVLTVFCRPSRSLLTLAHLASCPLRSVKLLSQMLSHKMQDKTV